MTLVGTLIPPEAAGAEALQVDVSAGVAVTVMYSDGASGRVSVVAGAVRVSIDTSGVDAGAT